MTPSANKVEWAALALLLPNRDRDGPHSTQIGWPSDVIADRVSFVIRKEVDPVGFPP